MFIPPFTILIDTREQLPYAFQQIPYRGGETVVVRHRFATLPSGDYSLEGLENEIAIERKSLADLFGTLSRGRDRFTRELERLAKFSFSAVVVEAALGDILNPQRSHPEWPSRVNPFAVFRSISAWSVQYPATHWYFCDTRHGAEMLVFHLMNDFFNRGFGDSGITCSKLRPLTPNPLNP